MKSFHRPPHLTSRLGASSSFAWASAATGRHTARYSTWRDIMVMIRSVVGLRRPKNMCVYVRFKRYCKNMWYIYIYIYIMYIKVLKSLKMKPSKMVPVNPVDLLPLRSNKGGSQPIYGIYWHWRFCPMESYFCKVRTMGYTSSFCNDWRFWFEDDISWSPSHLESRCC